MAKKIEEKYKELSEIDHILMRSGMWVGSTKEEEKDMFIFNPETAKMEMRTVNYVPGMLKVVDEVISNSCDEFRRPDNMGLNKLSVIIKGDTISVRDNGGIPIVKHKDAGCYVPEFIFGRLRTSSNYDDTEDRQVIGTNGVGSALCNVYSKRFTIYSADGKNSYYRSWKNNMRELCDDLRIEKVSKKDHFTETQFELDLERFGCEHISDMFKEIIRKRCIDAAAANPGLTVYFTDNNNETEVYNFKKFDEYIDLYSNYVSAEDKLMFSNDIATVYVFPDSNIDVAFVNGAECSKGTHIRAVRTSVNDAVVEFLKKKDKIEVTQRSVDGKYSVFCNINVSNPTYDSQTKDTLTTPVERFSKNENFAWEVPSAFLGKITRSEIIEAMRDWYKQKCAAEDQRTIRKLNSEAKKGLKRADKYITCSSKKKAERQLWIFEGDSAKAGFRGGRNPEIQAAYIMRGVPLNCYGMLPAQIMKNEVFNDLVSVLGLQWGKEFKPEQLNFGKIVISSDADVDGDKISALLLLFFNNWPELIENEIVCRSVSPIIISRKGKDCKKFYSMDEFKAVEHTLKGYSHKYTKGLGGLSNAESKEMYQEPRFLYFKKDENADNMFRKWFAKGDSETRKTLLSK